MLICLDYDETFTRDPEFWLAYIELVKKYNHEIICCTLRNEEEIEEVTNSIGKHIPVFYTSRQAKRDFLATKGVNPDVWIDDNPYWILIPAGRTPKLLSTKEEV